MNDDRFRNQTWNDSIAKAFFVKLKRARKSSRPQYLRIQACTLAKTHPEIALDLLDRYFEFGDHFHQAQAHVDQATGLVALGPIDEAIEAYEAALDREATCPNYKTQAHLELPYLIVVRGIDSMYQYADELLDKSEKRLIFAVDHSRWNAAKALLSDACSDDESAAVYARAALEAAGLDHSGM